MTRPVKIRHVGTPNFQSFISHNFLFHYCMAMNFLQFVKNLSGFVMQVTKWKYSILVIRYDSLSNKVYFKPTCTVLQARSQMHYILYYTGFGN